MKVLNLIQGSDKWLEARLQYLCASEAPVMMGCSKFMSRNQLLDLKKGWENNPIGSFKQKVFQRGHKSEAVAREILELEECTDLTPTVGLLYIEGLELLASFDGIDGFDGTPWEHKEWNTALAENVRNSVLEPMYYWQLEQHCLVSGSETVRFTCSDGTEKNRVSMFYKSQPDRQSELIDGWHQFVKDLAKHVISAKKEAVVATEAEAFPMIVCSVNGSMVDSNLVAYLADIKERAEIEMNRVLETDQDFADKEDLNKKTVKARADLKIKVANIQGQFISLADFSNIAVQIDSVLQKMQSQGEKQVKIEKENRKRAINNKAVGQIVDYATECDKKISPLSIASISKRSMPDFDLAMKGKRNLEAMKSAVDDLIAKEKIEIDAVMSRIVPNQIFLKEHATEYAFLFHDVAQIINQETEPFQAVVKSRIADHKAKEEEKAEKLRESIRIEEEKKATIKANNKITETPSQTVQPVYKKTSVDPAPGADRGVVSTVKPSDDPFAVAMIAWQEEYSISNKAMVALTSILESLYK